MAKTTYIPGKKVSQGKYTAFVPDPLPPTVEWTPRLIRLLSDADRLIGKLAGEGGRLPNPHVLMRPFTRREAVLSSKIEGTQATLGELLAAEAGIAVERSPDDLREVGNYVVALEHGISRLGKLPICVRLIRELHEKLMTDVRGHHATRGKFRKIQNWIGKPGSTPETASFIPPPHDEVVPCLAAWEKFLHESDLPPLIIIALAHYQFEAIHPFLDGNGRVGRLLITMFLIERKILPAPLLYLSAFFEASRRDYYDDLRGVSERGAWQDWIEYFLLGVARMSEDALSRAARINAKIAEWQKAASKNLVWRSQRPNAPLNGSNVWKSCSKQEQRSATVFTVQRHCSTFWKNQHIWCRVAIDLSARESNLDLSGFAVFALRVVIFYGVR
jgi:Fic family protein